MNQKPISDLTEKLLKDIIEKESITTLFQPIVSVKKRSVMGFEALSRGITNAGMISPSSLFDMAKETGSSLELDRLCRKKALENFAPYSKEANGFFLSINIESSILHEGKRSNHLLNMIDNLNLDPSSIILEILESDIKDLDVLKDFVERYRKQNFLIALDDVGSGFSNFGRIIDLCPDVIKIDRSLISGINNNFYSQEVLKSLISLAHGIGAIIIAEGIENEPEAITCLELGADLLQGYCFAMPGNFENIIESALPKIDTIAGRFREQMLSRIKTKRETTIQNNFMVKEIISLLSEIKPSRFNQMLSSALLQFPSIECSYIINSEGMQIGETVCGETMILNGKKIFSPDPDGTDQSFKDYFFYLKSGLESFTSDPYLSGATGKLCVTISTVFKGIDDFYYVLCCDIAQMKL